MSTLVFLFSEAQRNFRHKLFDLVKIAEWHFCTKLKRNVHTIARSGQCAKCNFRNCGGCTLRIAHFWQLYVRVVKLEFTF